MRAKNTSASEKFDPEEFECNTYRVVTILKVGTEHGVPNRLFAWLTICGPKRSAGFANKISARAARGKKVLFDEPLLDTLTQLKKRAPGNHSMSHNEETYQILVIECGDTKRHELKWALLHRPE
jgi:hypothetical protein